jgi:hypothetical protein
VAEGGAMFDLNENIAHPNQGSVSSYISAFKCSGTSVYRSQTQGDTISYANFYENETQSDYGQAWAVVSVEGETTLTNCIFRGTVTRANVKGNFKMTNCCFDVTPEMSGGTVTITASWNINLTEVCGDIPTKSMTRPKSATASHTPRPTSIVAATTNQFTMAGDVYSRREPLISFGIFLFFLGNLWDE